MAQDLTKTTQTVDYTAELQKLQYRKLLQELQDEETAKAEWERKEAKRLEGVKRDVEEATKTKIEQAHAQENCPHSAKNISFIRGQRLGTAKDKDGRIFNGFLAFCQFCKKQYDSYDAIPAHLRSDMEYFGGPKY